MSNATVHCCYSELVPKLEKDNELCGSLSSFHYWKIIKMMTSNSVACPHYWALVSKLEEDNELMFVILLHNCKK